MQYFFFDQSRTISVENLSSVNGVKFTIEELHKRYLKDKNSLAYEACEKYEKFSTPHEMSISDYVKKFEQLHQIDKSHKMEVLDGVFAYRLLNNANLLRKGNSSFKLLSEKCNTKP